MRDEPVFNLFEFPIDWAHDLGASERTEVLDDEENESSVADVKIKGEAARSKQHRPDR